MTITHITPREQELLNRVAELEKARSPMSTQEIFDALPTGTYEGSWEEAIARAVEKYHGVE